MSKQSWKPGNMLYPLPVVMVSCNRKGDKPNIVTVAWTGKQVRHWLKLQELI